MNVLRKLPRWIAGLALAGIGLFTLFAGFKWGWETGSSLGLLAFLFLGGLEAAGVLLARRLERRADESRTDGLPPTA